MLEEHSIVRSNDGEEEDGIPVRELDLDDAGKDELDEEIRDNDAIESVRAERVVLQKLGRLVGSVLAHWQVCECVQNNRTKPMKLRD